MMKVLRSREAQFVSTKIDHGKFLNLAFLKILPAFIHFGPVTSMLYVVVSPITCEFDVYFTQRLNTSNTARKQF